MMLQKKEIRAILIFVVFCFSIVLAEEQKLRTVRMRDPETGKMVTKQVPITPKQSDPCENTSVLVEAFMVRISTEALAEVGVNSIGQAPEGISILKIIACLDDPEKAQIISGAKLTVKDNKHSEIRNEETLYIKTGSGDSVSIDAYSSGKELTASPQIQQNGSVYLEANYSDSVFVENEDKTIPPTRINYDWNGILEVKSGVAIIAGVTQSGDSATILILMATIQD